MGKRNTRTLKFAEYREEIKQSSDFIDQQKGNKVLVKDTIKKESDVKTVSEKKKVKENKHTLDKNEENRIKKQKTVYDDYKKRKFLKFLLYTLFVVVAVSLAIFVLLLICSKFMGVKLWWQTIIR